MNPAFNPCQTTSGCTDTDNDGLCDIWETDGYIDVNGNGIYEADVDTDLPGADPSKPDIYVKYDYMEKAGIGAHTHDPGTKALGQVVNAFATHGVALRFSGSGASIAEHVVTTFDPNATASCAGDDFVTMQTLRAENLGNIKYGYHYMVFGHRVTCPDASHCMNCPIDPVTGFRPDPTQSGMADLPGDDVIVSFGPWFDQGTPIGIESMASTIMHELGHNFGLRHGGVDDANDKPHYISIMTYANQANGILVADAAGSVNFRSCVTDADCGPPTVASGRCATPNACHCTDDVTSILGYEICYRVDYSDELLPPLNETALNENVGVSGQASDTDMAVYAYHDVTGANYTWGASNGSPIDWSHNALIENSAQEDINNDGSKTGLQSQNDWEMSSGHLAHFDFKFQCMPKGLQAPKFAPLSGPASREHPYISCSPPRRILEH